ncbi:MAG: DUF4417 domain-containing protein, partial [bacterium]|nr:DUF4417 domain-containing protein [bacterium]
MTKVNNCRSGCKDVFRAFLVNSAEYAGDLEMPCIKPEDLLPTGMIAFSKAIRSKDYGKFVHFYEDDVNFERIWNNPMRYLPILRKFDGVIAPDFSMYRDMPLVMQEWNTYRNRAIGHWLQLNGIKVIPNVRFSDERSFQFCCDGISKGSTIAVGSHGCIKINIERKYFRCGMNYIVRKLEPKRIIVYGKAPNDIFDNY